MTALSLTPVLVMVGLLALVVVRLARWLFRSFEVPEKALAQVNAPTVGRFTRMIDTATVTLWPFRPKKVRMAFPCPACCQPLLGKVGPGEELVCPWCATTFQTPEPPPAAPPVSKKVLKKAKQAIQPKGSIFWRLFKFASIVLGIIVLVALVILGMLESGYMWLVLAGVLLAGWLGQAAYRRFWRKGNFLTASIFGEGGGTIIATEVIRSIGTVGAPLALAAIVWVLLGCFGGCLFPLFWGRPF
jgi:hypothetical protein